MKMESCQITARCQLPFRVFELVLEQMFQQMFRAFLKRWISAESLVYKWHPSVPFAQRFDPVDRHRLQLPLRLRHHMVHLLNMVCLCLMSNHAKAPKFGAFADLGRATTYRTNYCESVGLEAKNTF